MAAGEIVCLLCANGAGKTTTLNLCLGFTSPTSAQTPRAAERDANLNRLRFLTGAVRRQAGSYSKGMRQKLGLSIALLKGATSSLLNEPFSGLDPAANAQVTALRETPATNGLSAI